jgi:hypothetical protein
MLVVRIDVQTRGMTQWDRCDPQRQHRVRMYSLSERCAPPLCYARPSLGTEAASSLSTHVKMGPVKIGTSCWAWWFSQHRGFSGTPFPSPRRDLRSWRITGTEEIQWAMEFMRSLMLEFISDPQEPPRPESRCERRKRWNAGVLCRFSGIGTQQALLQATGVPETSFAITMLCSG